MHRSTLISTFLVCVWAFPAFGGSVRPVPQPITSNWAVEALEGLKIADERMCSPYYAVDYSANPFLRLEVAGQLGGFYLPYSLEKTTPDKVTLDHIIDPREAHESGLCSAPVELRIKFANDLNNLTLASPEVDRYEKRGSDYAEWTPKHNFCWMAGRIVAMRYAYRLTVDRP